MGQQFAGFIKRYPFGLQVIEKIWRPQLVDTAETGPIAAEALEFEMEPERLERFVERFRRIFGDVFQQGNKRVRIWTAAGQSGEKAVPPDAHGIDDGKKRIEKIFVFICAVGLSERDENFLLKSLKADSDGFCEVDCRMADGGKTMARTTVGGAFQIGRRADETFFRQDTERGVFDDQADVLRKQLVQRRRGFWQREIRIYERVFDFFRIKIALRQGRCFV